MAVENRAVSRAMFSSAAACDLRDEIFIQSVALNPPLTAQLEAMDFLATNDGAHHFDADADEIGRFADCHRRCLKDHALSRCGPLDASALD